MSRLYPAGAAHGTAGSALPSNTNTHGLRPLPAPQSTAKQRYYLTDGDLKRLGFLRKPNPHKKDWQPMHLYLESQVGRRRGGGGVGAWRPRDEG